MSYLIAVVAALIASVLTFFTGFGLGTLLLAAFVIMFPVAIAVAATAVVHLANNVFKLFLVAKHSRRDVVMQFGIPALLAAFVGAYLLTMVVDLPPLVEYRIGGNTMHITPVKLLIGVLMAAFSIVELSGASEKWVLDPKWMPAGGILSGLFGGLSGHQGAFRTMFLLKAGLTKEQFIGSGACIAVLVDLGRLTVYWQQLTRAEILQHAPLLAVTTTAAIVGTIIGSKLLKKITFRGIEITASILLLGISALLIAGLI